MKKFLLLISVILTFSGCSSVSYKKLLLEEDEKRNAVLNGKEFYTVEGKNYTCKVNGPFKAEAKNGFVFLKQPSGKKVYWLYSSGEEKAEVRFLDIKMEQTITSEDQFRKALKSGGCGCVWHVAEGREHYPIAFEKSVLDKELPIIKKAFEKKAIAIRKAAEKKAKEQAEKKQKAEQEASDKNNEVIRKYGKPYCDPFKSEKKDDNDYVITGGSSSRREKNCLFKDTFHISQVTPYGMLVHYKRNVCEGGFYHTYCHYEKDGPYFIIPNEKDAELVDGDSVSGLFEYVGPHTYEAIFGAPRTVLKFKHIE